MSKTYSRIISTGAYLPKKILTNKELEKIVDTSDEWIKQRTGIEARHIAKGEETTSFMASKAAIRALDNAKLSGYDIDAIILATTTADRTFPACAVTVQDNIGMEDKSFAFDVQAVCSGFIYALSIADNFIKAGQIKRALVIGVDSFSKILDWNDRTTCVLFGDGAAAVVVEATNDENSMILSTHLYSEGKYRNILHTDGGVSLNQQTGYVRMNGQEVFKHAVKRMSEAIDEALKANHLTADDISFLVPHQANKRIIDSIAKKLKLPHEKIILTLSKHGNTSAASIPLALHEAVSDGRIKRGDLLVMEAMGAGLTWGSALVRW